MDLRTLLTTALIESAKNYRRNFDESTGRFMIYPKGLKEGDDLSDKGWMVTNQDPVLAYAYLYKTPAENNCFYNDSETLNMVLKGVQAWRDWQYPDGTMEFIYSNGEKWGPTYMPWSWYHWLETYILLYDDLTAAQREDWETGLMPGLESYAAQNPLNIHNIPVWQAMCVHRGGKFFGRTDWVASADELIRNACAAQDPDGFWPEHKGPTVGYNLIYMHSLGLYRFHGGVVDVMPSIRRGTTFMQMFTYPDGSHVDTVDGRQRYHHVRGERGKGTTGVPAYLLTEAGRAYIRANMYNFSLTNISLSHTATALLMLDNFTDEVDGYSGLDGFAEPDFTRIYGKSSIVRRNGAQITLSAYTAPPTESHWGFDRQAFVSVWTEDAGLIMGSGNSKNQPECGTFVISDAAGNVLSYIPTSGRIVADGVCELVYEDKGTCRIEGSIDASGRVELRYIAKLADPAYRWQVGLPLRPGFEITSTDVKVTGGKGTTTVSFSGREISFDAAYEMNFPTRPYNPYSHEGIPSPDDYLLVVNLFPERDSTVVRFSVAETNAETGTKAG